MSENEKNVPKRRFKEFENAEAWEQRRLTDFMNRVSQSSNASNLPKVEFEDIVSGQGMLNKDISKKFDSRKGILFEPNNILFGKLRPYLKNWLFPNFQGIALGDFWVFEAKDSEPIFDYYLIQTDKYQRVANDTAGTKMPRSDWKYVSTTEFCIPTNLKEQEKIGSFFKHLDNLIALHQRKLEKMKALKKAYLTELFPAEGERNPKLRFAGFKDDWEQRKVKDIFNVTRGYVLAATETTDKKTDEMPYPVYSSQTKDNGLMGYYKDFLYESAITWTTDGANAGTVNYRDGKFYCTNVCGVLLSDDGYANKMVSEALNNISWKHVSKVGNPKLMNNVMSEIVVSLPKTIEEQNTISDFLNRLDNRISLHEHKLEKLQNIKKAYLNEMFI